MKGLLLLVLLAMPPPPAGDLAILDAHVARGDCPDAMALIKVMEARGPSQAVRYHAGLARIACGDLDAGVRMLETLALDAPFGRAGKEAAATVSRIADRVVSASDREALEGCLRAWFCVFAKDPARARDLVLSARKAARTGPFADTYCLVLAQAYEALGDRAGAHREYERLVLEHPDSPYYSTAQFKVVGRPR